MEIASILSVSYTPARHLIVHTESFRKTVDRGPLRNAWRPILNHLRRGELVFDPFLGSGTTLAAAELTERICYGIELDPKYADVIVIRWQSLSGKQATLDGDGRTFEEVPVMTYYRTPVELDRAG